LNRGADTIRACRSGSQVSIGSDAVHAVAAIHEREARGEPGLSGKTGIETILSAYGNQAVVISVDPKRVYVSPSATREELGPHFDSLVIGAHARGNVTAEERGQAWWYQCTINGGRAVVDMDVVQLAKGVERLGAGELLLNSVDRDGSGRGFDLDLVQMVRDAVSIPVVASSGAGKVEDFVEVFDQTGVEAALAAGIFHREEVPIQVRPRAHPPFAAPELSSRHASLTSHSFPLVQAVKAHLREKNIPARRAKDVAGDEARP